MPVSPGTPPSGGRSPRTLFTAVPTPTRGSAAGAPTFDRRTNRGATVTRAPGLNRPEQDQQPGLTNIEASKSHFAGRYARLGETSISGSAPSQSLVRPGEPRRRDRFVQPGPRPPIAAVTSRAAARMAGASAAKDSGQADAGPAGHRWPTVTPTAAIGTRLWSNTAAATDAVPAEMRPSSTAQPCRRASVRSWRSAGRVAGPRPVRSTNAAASGNRARTWPAGRWARMDNPVAVNAAGSRTPTSVTRVGVRSDFSLARYSVWLPCSTPRWAVPPVAALNRTNTGRPARSSG